MDSAVFSQSALQFLVETMSEDRVLLGSDYPFPLGEHNIGSLIRSSQLPQTAKQKLLGDNAAVFLRLEPSTSSAVEKTEAVASGPSLPHEDQLTYSSYLKVPELLELQHPQSKPEHHDELLFIIVHQTYELWFKELLHDLDAVVANLWLPGAALNHR